MIRPEFDKKINSWWLKKNLLPNYDGAVELVPLNKSDNLGHFIHTIVALKFRDEIANFRIMYSW